LNILLNKEIDEKYWNSLIKNKAMQRFEWLYVISESYGLKPFYLLAFEGDRYALVGSFETRKGFVSLPFLSFSGYSTNDASALSALEEYIIASVGVDIDSRDAGASMDGGSVYVTSVIALEDLDAYWALLSVNMRNQIRKSQSFGFKSAKSRVMGDGEYSLYAKAMHRLGTPVHKKLFFCKILEHIPESFVLTIYEGSTEIGFMLCVYDGDTLYDLFAATDPKYNASYANYYLYYEALKTANEAGLKKFDMGRSTYGSGVHKFKQKWKPTDYPISSKLKYDKSGSMGLASSIWQKLPYTFTLWLGPKVRKYLP